MTIKAAFDELAKLSVTGITRNFYGSTVPGPVGSSLLPCKITLLDNTDRSEAEAEGFTVSRADFKVYCRILLLRTFATAGTRAVQEQNYLSDMDRIASALDGKWNLSDKIVEPLKVISMRPGQIRWAGQTYLGVETIVMLPVQIT